MHTLHVLGQCDSKSSIRDFIYLEETHDALHAQGICYVRIRMPFYDYLDCLHVEFTSIARTKTVARLANKAKLLWLPNVEFTLAR